MVFLFLKNYQTSQQRHYEKNIFLLLILGFATGGYAQNEFSNKFKAIPPVDNSYTPKKAEIKNNDPAVITAPNIFKKP